MDEDNASNYSHWARHPRSTPPPDPELAHLPLGLSFRPAEFFLTNSNPNPIGTVPTVRTRESNSRDTATHFSPGPARVANNVLREHHPSVYEEIWDESDDPATHIISPTRDRNRGSQSHINRLLRTNVTTSPTGFGNHESQGRMTQAPSQNCPSESFPGAMGRRPACERESTGSTVPRTSFNHRESSVPVPMPKFLPRFQGSGQEMAFGKGAIPRDEHLGRSHRPHQNPSSSAALPSATPWASSFAPSHAPSRKDYCPDGTEDIAMEQQPQQSSNRRYRSGSEPAISLPAPKRQHHSSHAAMSQAPTSSSPHVFREPRCPENATADHNIGESIYDQQPQANSCQPPAEPAELCRDTSRGDVCPPVLSDLADESAAEPDGWRDTHQPRAQSFARHDCRGKHHTGLSDEDFDPDALEPWNAPFARRERQIRRLVRKEDRRDPRVPSPDHVQQMAGSRPAPPDPMKQIAESRPASPAPSSTYTLGPVDESDPGQYLDRGVEPDHWDSDEGTLVGEDLDEYGRQRSQLAGDMDMQGVGPAYFGGGLAQLVPLPGEDEHSNLDMEHHRADGGDVNSEDHGGDVDEDEDEDDEDSDFSREETPELVPDDDENDSDDDEPRSPECILDSVQIWQLWEQDEN